MINFEKNKLYGFYPLEIFIEENEIINDFRENGINECINMNYCKVPNYVVSATNVYTIVKSGSPNR